MRNIFLALALLIFGWAASASAAPSTHATESVRYTGYYYGAGNPHVLAKIYRDARAKDQTGRTMFDADKCRRDGSCGAPLNLVESFQAHDPLGGWTLENAADKLDTLVLKCGFVGVYQMDRIVLKAGSSFGRSDINGMSRSFDRGNERGCAWVNPETGQPVLAPNCANPVGVRIDLDCVYIDARSEDVSEFALAWWRYDRADDKCFAYRFVDKTFQADSPSAVWHPMPRGECIGRPCSTDGADRVNQRRRLAQGRITGIAGRRVQIRVERNSRVDLCLKHWVRDPNTGQWAVDPRTGERLVGSSFSVDTSYQRGDYQPVRQGARVEEHALVYYQTSEMRADGIVPSNRARSMAFYASTKEDEDTIRQLMLEPRSGE